MSRKFSAEKREEFLQKLPKAICSFCGKPIEDETETCPVKHGFGKYAIYRMYHEKCHTAFQIKNILTKEINTKGWT
jgi:ribosomal protein L24E